MEAINVSTQLLCELLKPLSIDSNKGTNGTLDIVAGSSRFRGAADMCVGAALRTGVGIVRLISEEPVISAVSTRHPSCTFLPVANATERQNAIYSANGSCFLIGCGLGFSANTTSDVSTVLALKKRTVLDADALNVISASPELADRISGCIITPHVGEFSRLSGISIDKIKSDPLHYAKEYSQKHGCATVLKDHITVICTPSGESFVSDGANPGLSKGGSGDVLAGLIAGFFAQGYSARDSAVIGVTLHALASQLCAKDMGTRSMLPSELELYVAKALLSLGY